ncbi:trans-aconitate 2-methyltransferase [Anatilimnocola floriformis]|uniref:trans-aconitate 2-methyltransferase n=1 Tax=Anatilimnocola floriformis TaxID=2948575 RepID=UPI0020C49B57|nr:trans-aconitate 2-methyltransferase [Anatilimnocola floriformis]
MTWSPTQYGKFEAERNRPIRDLLAQLPVANVARIADLGCGPGNSTELLIEQFPNATVIGMDNSSDMLTAARQRLPGIRFEASDIAAWQDAGPFDLLFANAALQWVPSHETLLPFLFQKLATAGTLAVQIPDNLDEPAHRLMREVAAAGPWAEKWRAATQDREARHSAEWYYQMLSGLGARVDVWRTIYHHPLPGGVAAIAEWFKGSGLRPFLQPLDETEKAEFLTRYIAALGQEYSELNGGVVLLPFPRLFFVATRLA